MATKPAPTRSDVAISKLTNERENALSAAKEARESRVFIVTIVGCHKNPARCGKLQKKRDLTVARKKSEKSPKRYAPPSVLAASGLNALRSVAPR